jgi:hypothetical protein
MKVSEMRQEELARAPAVSAALADEDIASIEECIALAQRLLDEEKSDEAALALDGVLWRMARLVSGEHYALGDSFWPGSDEMIEPAEADSQIFMRLCLALRARDVQARLAHLRALLAYVEQNKPMAEWDAFGGAGPCMRIAPWKGSGYDGD